MKSILKLASLCLVLVAGSAQASPASIDVVNTKYKNLFVFKVDRDFIGAEVEVYYSNGDLVTLQKVRRRKMIIDFCDAKAGSYIIKVRNGKQVLDFQYVKK